MRYLKTFEAKKVITNDNQGQKVIMDKLSLIYQLGMDIPENIEFRNYEII